MANGAKTCRNTPKSGDYATEKMARHIDRGAIAVALRQYMTPDEAIAFAICFGDAMPDSKHTRVWAARTVRQFASANLTGKMAGYALVTDDLNKIIDIADFLVPKAARVADDGASQEEFSITITKRPFGEDKQSDGD